MHDNITAEVMEQYEQVRRLGACNMYNIECVRNCADRLELFALGGITAGDYMFILSNFSMLMKRFGISRGEPDA